MTKGIGGRKHEYYGKENEKDKLVLKSRGWKIYKRTVLFPGDREYYAIGPSGGSKVEGNTAEETRVEALLSC